MWRKQKVVRGRAAVDVSERVDVDGRPGLRCYQSVRKREIGNGMNNQMHQNSAIDEHTYMQERMLLLRQHQKKRLQAQVMRNQPFA